MSYFVDNRYSSTEYTEFVFKYRDFSFAVHLISDGRHVKYEVFTAVTEESRLLVRYGHVRVLHCI
jgi:hypothetical protein